MFAKGIIALSDVLAARLKLNPDSEQYFSRRRCEVNTTSQ